MNISITQKCRQLRNVRFSYLPIACGIELRMYSSLIIFPQYIFLTISISNIFVVNAKYILIFFLLLHIQSRNILHTYYLYKRMLWLFSFKRLFSKMFGLLWSSSSSIECTLSAEHSSKILGVKYILLLQLIRNNFFLIGTFWGVVI